MDKVLDYNTRVMISKEYGLRSNLLGRVIDIRGVGLTEQTESVEYLIESITYDSYWVPERYLEVI